MRPIARISQGSILLNIMWTPRFLALALVLLAPVDARPWAIIGNRSPFEAGFVGMKGTSVILRGANGNQREFALESFSPEDQVRLFEMELANGRPFSFPKQSSLTSRAGYRTRSLSNPGASAIELEGSTGLTVTDAVVSLEGGVNFLSPDSWLFFENIRPSVVLDQLVARIRVYGAPAVPGKNLRVVQHASGSVVIPHGEDFPAMTLFASTACSGPSMPVRCHADESALKGMETIASFRLKRGYMATLAKNKDGTGPSRNYVAQDHDLEVPKLPAGLDQGVGFLRVFPWRWTSKKGVAGAIWKDLNVGWFYDWNISTHSTPDIEYVPIRQNRWWPGLNQDWRARGSLHLLGFNEPDRPDQAKMTVDEAISAWPELLRTGLRLGSPAPADSGLPWLYQFIDKADATGLRVDFVAVHYYRAYSDPGDAKGAARQLQNYLKGVHERTKRPIWVTEWNNGANWTREPKPNERQQRDAIREMIEMLDETPYVERYAIYNWVEDVRHVKRKDGSLPPAGEAYRDRDSPPAYQQTKPKP
jgi:hypothetical protein